MNFNHKHLDALDNAIDSVKMDAAALDWHQRALTTLAENEISTIEVTVDRKPFFLNPGEVPDLKTILIEHTHAKIKEFAEKVKIGMEAIETIMKTSPESNIQPTGLEQPC